MFEASQEAKALCNTARSFCSSVSLLSRSSHALFDGRLAPQACQL